MKVIFLVIIDGVFQSQEIAIAFTGRLELNTKVFDCLIIGGGPAGLVAATYLRRFYREVLINPFKGTVAPRRSQ